MGVRANDKRKQSSREGLRGAIRGEDTKRNLKHVNGGGVGVAGELNRCDMVVPVEANFE
jgi:hypothetical protein